MSERVIELTPERIARFWAKVDMRGPDECWPWRGAKHTHGYGLYAEFDRRGKQSVRFYAHRMSALIAGREISGRVVRHRCDNPPCVNPRHLCAGAQADNVRDAVERGRLNMTGLVLGQRYEFGARPCRCCGVTIDGGRHAYCSPCGEEVQRLSKKGVRAEQAREMIAQQRLLKVA